MYDGGKPVTLWPKPGIEPVPMLVKEQEARFVLPADANAIQMLTPQGRLCSKLFPGVAHRFGK